MQMKGKLQFNITPLTSKIEMKKDGLIYQEWTGMKILRDVPIGEYEIICKSEGFKTKKEKVIVELDKTTSIDLIMEEGSDILENMIFVQGGTFQMGSNNGGSDEKPIHEVYVSDFYIGKTEVTQKEWNDVMGNNPSHFKGDNLPVEQVRWYDALEFCNKKSEQEGLTRCYTGSLYNIKCNFNANGYRLPSEAEWEYAARGGNKSKGYKYSGSNNVGDVAWYKNDSDKKTHPVGTKKANELGIYDMSGNVWEWCNDWYNKKYYKNSPWNNPKGSSSGSRRVKRGGSVRFHSSSCFTAVRSSYFPLYTYGIIGFRIVRSVE